MSHNTTKMAAYLQRVCMSNTAPKLLRSVVIRQWGSLGGGHLSSAGPLHCLKQNPMNEIYSVQTRNFAARRGTRERKLKLQKARKLLLQSQAAQKEASGSRQKVSKLQLPSRLRTSLKETRATPIDDVWLAFYSRLKFFTIKEAIEMHREMHHPTMMNLPDAPLHLSLELDMRLEKKNKFLDNFTRVIKLPYFYDDGKNKSVIAFCKVNPIETSPDEQLFQIGLSFQNEVNQQQAIEAGADMVGGIALIKRVQGGEAILADYKYIVAHPDIANEISSLRGIMKKRFPMLQKGTMGADMYALVEHFKKGLEYMSETDNVKQDFGWVDVPVGPLSMPIEHLEANIEAIVESVCKYRPSRKGPFITVAVLTSPPSKEKIAVDVSAFQPIVAEEDDDDEEETAQKAA